MLLLIACVLLAVLLLSPLGVSLTVTTTQVLLNTGPSEEGVSGEALTAGMGVYRKQSDGKWYKGQSDGTQEEQGQYGLGIVVNDAPGVGQRAHVALPGADVTLGAGAAPAASTHYTLAAAAGSIAPVADVTVQGHWRPALCVGKGSNKVRVIGQPAESAIP